MTELDSLSKLRYNFFAYYMPQTININSEQYLFYYDKNNLSSTLIKVYEKSNKNIHDKK